MFWFRKYKILATAILAILLLTPAKPRAEVRISPILQRIIPETSDRVKAGQVVSKPIPFVTRSDVVHLKLRIDNAVFKGMSVWVCDENNRRMLLARRNARCIGGNDAVGHYQLSAKPYGTGVNYLMFDNTRSLLLTKKIRYLLVLNTPLTSNMRQSLQGIFDRLSANIKRTFKAPPFGIFVRPCGEVNAFSSGRTGDITLCSELVLEAMFAKKGGMLTGIFFHELGHTLLNLWGDPNWHNERTADEFAAVVMILSGQQNAIQNWIRWYEANEDWVREAQIIVATKDLHPLNVQRISAIRDIQRYPSNYIPRWNRLIYPHLTDRELDRIITAPRRFENPRLAKMTLKGR